MKKILLILTVCLFGISNGLFAQTCDGDDIIITSGVSGGTETTNASSTIVTQSGTSIVIEGNANVTYKAGTSITLNSGFKVELGAEFSATIVPCTMTTSGTFVTTWRIDPNDLDVTIPTFPSPLGTYSYTVDWGDNSTDTTIYNGDANHTYPTATSITNYVVTITGTFPRIYFNNSGDKDKIIEIVEWGDMVWTSMENAFYGCVNLKIDSTIPDKPDLFLVSNMDFMFAKASKIDYDFGGWDVSNVTTMAQALTGTKLSRTNYENTLNGWSTLSNLKSNVNLGAGGLKFCDDTGRIILTDPAPNGFNWNIQGDSVDVNCPPIPGAPPNQSVINLEQEFKIYPNPATDKIYISGLENRQSDFKVQIVDLRGRVFFREDNQTEFDISRLKSGIYFIQVLGEQKKKLKFIKL